MPDEVRVVAVIERNASEQVRIALTRFKGHDRIDVRVFERSAGTAGHVPTKRGITLHVSQLTELEIAITKLRALVDDLRSRGMLPPRRPGRLERYRRERPGAR